MGGGNIFKCGGFAGLYVSDVVQEGKSVCVGGNECFWKVGGARSPLL